MGVNHQGQFVASTISFNLPVGVSLSEATQAVDDAMLRLGVPNTVHGSFQGSARAFQASLSSQPWLILAALITVYIVLGVLYESYVHPITILSTLPSAGVGALLALMLFHTDFSIIAFIGVILLIGIVKKNAIMMIDFALEAERVARPEYARCDFRGVRAALPPDHDDDHGGDARRIAAGARRGRWSGNAASARHRDRRRSAGQPGADAIHDAGGLSLSRPSSGYGRCACERERDTAGRCRPRKRLIELLPIPMSNELKMKIASQIVGTTALLTLSAAALYGCMVGPDYVRPTAPVPAAYKEIDGWKVAQPGDEGPRGNWWEAFNDPDLNALEAQVDISNQTIQAAAAAMREARAATQAARAALFPVVTGDAAFVRSSRVGGTTSNGANAGNSNVNGASNSYNVALDASWEIDLWGGIRRSIEASDTTAQATAADLANATLSAQAMLADDYLLLRVQDATIDLLRDTVSRVPAFSAPLPATNTRPASPGVATSRKPKPSSSRRKRRSSMRRSRAHNSNTRLRY